MNQTQKSESKLQSALEEAARDTNSFDIGVSVGAVTPDVTWTGTTGTSNLATQEPTQATDLFDLGSIGKSYNSVIILRLQEQGKLSLDDTLDKWLPDIAAQIINDDNLTIRQLLNGTGGLPDFTENQEFQSDLLNRYLSDSDKDWQPEEFIAYIFDKPLFSGESSTEQWTYPNTGNIIAALIIEEATGKPFEQVLREEIIKPLKLNNTFSSSQEVSSEQRVKQYGDILTADGTLGQDGIRDDLSNIDSNLTAYGGESIVSNAEDVALFFDSLASGNLLQLESNAEVLDYVNTGQNTGKIEFDKYGLGVYPTESAWGETISSDGGSGGYVSWVNYFSDSDTTISVLVNLAGDTPESSRADIINQTYKASVANTLGFSDESAINGTETEDYLTGTPGNDIIKTKEGDDTILGKDGFDALDGGAGDDFLDGGAGDDFLFGKEGQDILNGGNDTDFLNGGVNDDILNGGNDDDTLVGSLGNDTLDGGEDSDDLSGGEGDDVLRDTQGNNFLYGNDGNDLLFAGMENDVLYGDAGDDRLNAGAGDDRLFGGSGNDELSGGIDDDSLIGGEGNDTLAGLSGDDTLTGDAGRDLFVLSTDGTDSITDFTPGQDLLELPKNTDFSDLQISQGQGDNVDDILISFQSEIVAVLNDTNLANISQSDFILFLHEDALIFDWHKN